MEITIRHAEDPQDDLVQLKDGTEFTWPAWLNRTEHAVHAVRTAFDVPIKDLGNERLAAAKAGHDWLVACGVVTLSDFLDLELHLSVLRQPPDPSNTRHCRRCGSEIWGRESLLTGLGSECRRISIRARRYLKAESARVAVRTSQTAEV